MPKLFRCWCCCCLLFARYLLLVTQSRHCSWLQLSNLLVFRLYLLWSGSIDYSILAPNCSQKIPSGYISINVEIIWCHLHRYVNSNRSSEKKQRPTQHRWRVGEKKCSKSREIISAAIVLFHIHHYTAQHIVHRWQATKCSLWVCVHVYLSATQTALRCRKIFVCHSYRCGGFFEFIKCNFYKIPWKTEQTEHNIGDDGRLYVFHTYHLIAIPKPIRPSAHKRIWRVVCISLCRTFSSVSSWNICLILLETPAADDTNEAFYKVHVTNHFTHSWLWNQNAIQDGNRLSIFVGILFPAIMSFYCLAIEYQSRASNKTENCNKQNRPQTWDVILESFVALVFKYLLYALARVRSYALRVDT